MKNRCLVISLKGLGDGVISLALSNNLYQNGFYVQTFHDGALTQLQNWAPHLPIKKFPPVESVSDIVKDFDHIFVFYDSVDPFIQAIIKEAKSNYPDKIKVINPSFSRTCGNQPYYEDASFRRDVSMIDNIENFCRNIINLKVVTKKNGLKCPYGNLILRKNKVRVAIHPTSAKIARSWSKEKFLDLYKKLKNNNFDPVFVMSDKEMSTWKEGLKEEVHIEGFSSFDDLAKYIYESGYLIGNDSGIAHLASSLGLPVLCISRSKRTTDLWRPGWGIVKVVHPSTLIPNISGFRLRDKKWQFFISTKKVFKNFMKVVLLDLKK